jgi:hypothetical protein
MKTIYVLILVVLLVNNGLWAQSTGITTNQSLMLEVKPITKIVITGSLAPLVITDAVDGSDLLSVSDDNTKYSFVTNLDNLKIVASINDQMPTGTKLMIKVTSCRATSVGLVDVSRALTPVDVVTGISRGSDADQSIVYTFAANADVREIVSQSRTVTLTLTN